jgi:hypothetical protein
MLLARVTCKVEEMCPAMVVAQQLEACITNAESDNRVLFFPSAGDNRSSKVAGYAERDSTSNY